MPRPTASLPSRRGVRIALATLLVTAVASALPGQVEATQIARSKRLGLGLATGTQISGLSAKVYLQRQIAVQAVGGWWSGGNIGLNVDALYTIGRGTRLGDAGTLAVSVGAGAFLILAEGSARIPAVAGVLEVGWHFGPFPLELVVGWRPKLCIGVTKCDTTRQVGFGARWYL